MGHKGPVLRSRYIGPGRARTQTLFYSRPYTALDRCLTVNMEHWWDAVGGKRKYSEQTPSRCYFVYHKYQAVCPGIEHESPHNFGYASYNLTDVHIFNYRLAYVIHVSKTTTHLIETHKYVFPYLFFFDRGKQHHQNLPRNRK
jgi:hypothetical protein